MFLVALLGSIAGTALWRVQTLLERPDLSPADIVGPVDIALPLVVIVTVLCFGLIAVGGWYAISFFRSTLDTLLRTTRQMRDGDMDVDVEIHRQDELGDLARNLREMSDALKRRTVSRSYLDDVLDSMAEMLFVVDDSNRIDHVNRAAVERLGFSPSDLKGRFLDDLLIGDDPLPSPDDTVFRRTGSVTQIERQIQTEDGDNLPVLVSRSLLRGSPANAPDIVCVAQDISARKRAEEQLRNSLREKEVLLREIHHRVKNNLQVIASLLHVQSKKVEDEDAKRLFEESQDRIRSMAFIHERLYQSEDLSQVNFSAYLDRLTEHLYRSHGVALRDVTCKLESEDAILAVDRAIPAGLIVNELVSNALEHAFPDDHGGTITVAFTTDDDTGCLRISDNGVGLENPEEVYRDQTLGIRLVKGLVRQLRGEMDIDGEQGLTYTITFPLTDEEPATV
ncbi:sensor histidine kinase [Longibacter salinarum]|uniref:sensor histidine kinase n=1 Tax=Longibacter salinarum TaxID=1850348 RepID=UPI0015CF165E|nr:histidine kinase dimerization/phosphoacceptor domain -containing protein [Longibacter salinarum]